MESVRSAPEKSHFTEIPDFLLAAPGLRSLYIIYYELFSILCKDGLLTFFKNRDNIGEGVGNRE